MKKYLLLGYGLAMTAVIATLAWFPSVHAFPWPSLPIFGLAFAIYVMAARVARDQANEPLTLRTIWLVAVASTPATLGSEHDGPLRADLFADRSYVRS